MPECIIINFVESHHQKTPWSGFNLSLHLTALKLSSGEDQTSEWVPAGPQSLGLSSEGPTSFSGCFALRMFSAKLQTQPSHPPSLLEPMSTLNSKFSFRADHRGQQKPGGGGTEKSSMQTKLPKNEQHSSDSFPPTQHFLPHNRCTWYSATAQNLQVATAGNQLLPRAKAFRLPSSHLTPFKGMAAIYASLGGFQAFLNCSYSPPMSFWERIWNFRLGWDLIRGILNNVYKQICKK